MQVPDPKHPGQVHYDQAYFFNGTQCVHVIYHPGKLCLPYAYLPSDRKLTCCLNHSRTSGANANVTDHILSGPAEFNFRFNALSRMHFSKIDGVLADRDKKQHNQWYFFSGNKYGVISITNVTNCEASTSLS
jgi:hypothetical protein